jgi:TRAP transporter TAXI family solute receptor
MRREVLKNGKKPIKIVTLSLLTVFVLSGCSGNKEASSAKPETIEITWGASPATSAYYAIYSSLAVGIQRANPHLNITVMETGGAADSARKLRDGVCEMSSGNVQSDMESYFGTGNFAGEPRPDLRVLWLDHISYYQWVATKDSGIKTLRDYDNKYINPGGIGTQQAQISQGIFKLFGITPRLLEGNQSVASDAFQNRQIVGIAKLGPVPDSFLTQMQATQELVFIDISEEEYRQILTLYPFMIRMTIPAGTYEKIDEWHTIALLGGADTTNKMPQEVGYTLIKGLMVDARAEWEAAYPDGKDNDILGWTLESKTPLHAGTVQFLVEAGYTVPPDLVPPEYIPVK